MSTLPITVFSDFSCPASYVTEAALGAIGDEAIEVRYCAFELYPNPEAFEAKRFGAEEWSGLEELARAAGVTIHPRVGVPNTRKAHEAAAFAREHALEDRMRQEIFAAYWAEDRDIARIDILAELGGRVGIDPEDLRIALDIDRYADDVEQDEDLARRLRIPGTPVLFLGSGREAQVVAGARSIPELRSVIQTAMRDRIDRTDNV